VEFRILGPLELWSDGRRHEVERAKQRLVLAILLQTPGRPVSRDKLIDYVWDGDAPPKARDNLYSHVSRLRGLLGRLDGNVSIDTFRPGLYVLHADELTIDLFRFKMLRRQARAISESGDDKQALDLLRRALDLWHGEPLANVSGGWAERTGRSLEDEFFATTLERVEIELRLGHHADLVTELSDLVIEHPYNEKLVCHLMEALYRGGRQAEALQVYGDARNRLREALGTDPGEEPQELYRRILAGDRTLLPVPRAQPAAFAPRSTLPDDIRLFTGREEEITQLLAMASSTGPGYAAHPTVIAIDGMAGVGKTVLSVHLAHRLAGEYPDAQVYIDLHGYDADHAATDPGTALDTLLQMLGIPAQRIPRSIEDRTALWRSELARRRVLVVLDNAAGHEQIRPLLSSAPGCLTLVTSRRRLVGLDDVRSISLDVLSPADAGRLLERAIGPGRSPTSSDLAEVVRLCGFLPLAIQLVGNRLRHRTAWTVAALAKRLAGRRLAEIRAEGREITAVFDLSYRGLAPEARLAFRRLGLHLGPDVTLHSAAAAIGGGLADADRAIEDLLDQHLLTEPAEGRYRFHGLIREYARQLAESEDPPAERADAVRRQLDHYVSTALIADRLLYPLGRRLGSGPVIPLPDPEPIETAEQAREWLATEYQNLLAFAEYDVTERSPVHTALLAHALARHLEAEGHWDKAATLHEHAVGAWRELEDAAGEAQALLDLSLVRFRTGQYGEALDEARESLGIYRSIGDQRGEADVLDHVGLIHWQQSRYREALTYSRKGLLIRRATGDLYGEARALDHIAIFLEFTGRYRDATDSRMRALSIHAEIDDSSGRQMALNNMGDLKLKIGEVTSALTYYSEAETAAAQMGRQHEAIWWTNLANVFQHTGRCEEALARYRTALRTYKEIGDRRSEVETLIAIGSTFQRMGQFGEALIHHQRALSLAREIAERYEEVRALRSVGEALLNSRRFAAAMNWYQGAVNLAHQIGEPLERARSLEGMGSVLLHVRGRAAARKRWKQALRLYERIRLPAEAEAVRTLLERADQAIEG
jgi:DNA-binding SARP family transcriptional activator/Tfp pilus assembly protein PilF